MQVVQGDLIKLALQGKFDVIVHGCNCRCAMGKGIAQTIRIQFPQAYAADVATGTTLGRAKLGTISVARVKRGGHEIHIVNAYTQDNYRGQGPNKDGVLVECDAVREAFKTIKAQFHGKRIGYPKIGAGLANGDWNVIAQIINDELNGEDHCLVEFVRG